MVPNTTCLPNAGLKLAQRRRCWANFNPALCQHIVFAGAVSSVCTKKRGRSPTACGRLWLCDVDTQNGQKQTNMSHISVHRGVDIDGAVPQS